MIKFTIQELKPPFSLFSKARARFCKVFRDFIGCAMFLSSCRGKREREREREGKYENAKVGASINSDDRCDRSTCRWISSLTPHHSSLVSISYPRIDIRYRRRRSMPKRAILMMAPGPSRIARPAIIASRGMDALIAAKHIKYYDCIIGIESGCYA